MSNRVRTTITSALLLLAMLCLPTRSYALCSQGDLVYEAGWVAYNEVPGYQVRLDLLIWVETTVVAMTTATDWEYVERDIYYDIPACGHDQAAGAEAHFWVADPYSLESDLSIPLSDGEDRSDARSGWIYLGMAYDSWTLPGAGPNSVPISMAAFIPEEWLYPPGSGEYCVSWAPSIACPIVEGDNRGFSYYGGTARISTLVELANTGISDGDIIFGPYHSVGLSQEYDAASSLSGSHEGYLLQSARDDWTWGYPQKEQWGTASDDGMECGSATRLGDSVGGLATSAVRITCTGVGTYPFSAFAPAIDWEYEITLVFGNNGYDYTITGCHDGFPNHEVYLSGNNVLEFYKETFASLFPPCEINVNKTGSIR